MYTSFTAKNFRLFSDLTVEPLARINLISGKNNTGKTALLEALWIYTAPTNAHVSVAINARRGIQRFPVSAKAVWENLFLQFDISQAIVLQARSENGEMHQLQIYLETEAQKTISFSPDNGGNVPEELDADLNQRLIYCCIDVLGNKIVTAYGDVTDKINVTRPKNSLNLPALPNIFISARIRTSIKDAAEYYTSIQRRLHESLMLEGVQKIESTIEDIRLGFYGGEPMFECKVSKGDFGRRMPLSFMGDGLNRYFNVLLAIGAAKDGVVFIDEIENGLHYTVMADVWKAIHQLAQAFNVQVFATTHSLECIRAAHEAFGENPGDAFKYHRLDRSDGEVKITTYSDESFAGAFEFGIEVR